MKKILYFLPLIIFNLFIRCTDDSIKSDSRFETDIETTLPSSGNIYANTPVELTITLRHERNIGTYHFSYTFLEGVGDLYVKNQKLPEKEIINLNEGEFKAYFIPTNIGEHRLKLTFSNNDFITETIYSISADNFSMDITEPSAENMYLNQDMYLYFSFIAENDTCDNFVTDIVITKGEGFISKIETADTDILTLSGAYHTPLDSLFACLKNDKRYKIKKGLNRIKYIPGSIGEHILHLSITNDLGYTQDFDLSFDVGYPPYSFSTYIDSIVAVNAKTRFGLTIEDQNPERYVTSYHFIRNSGKIELNGNSADPDKPFILRSGESTGFITVDSTCEAVIEFMVKDSYTNEKKGILKFPVIKSYTDISVSGFDSLPLVNQEYPFSITAATPNYQGNYKLEIESKNAEVKIDNKIISDNEEIIFSKTINASYKPLYQGKDNLIIKLTDETERKSTHKLIFTSSDISRKISVKEYEPLVKVQNNVRVYFDVNSNVKAETYTCRLSFTAGITGATLNGKLYTEECSINKKNNYIDFIPPTTGDINLNIEVRTNSGSSIKKELIFSASNDPVEIKLSGYEKELTAGKETSFSFRISKNDFSGPFSYSLRKNQEPQMDIRINDRAYTEETLQANNNDLITVKLLPLKTGSNIINIIISDGINETRYPLSFNISGNPIKISFSGFESECLKNSENGFSLSVSKKDYSGLFRCTAELTPSDAGKLKINDYIIENGKEQILNPENDIRFIPCGTGKSSLLLTIQDDFGNKESKIFTYNTSEPELELIPLSAIEESINPVKGGTINLAVKKANYTGKFFLEIEQEGCTSVKVANIPYTTKTETDPDNIPIKFQPSGTGQIKLKITVSDEQGQSVSKTYIFSISDSDLELDIDNPLNETMAGKPILLNFTAHKPGYTGTLKYFIKGIPSGNTIYHTDGQPYPEGEEKNLPAATNVPVTLTFKKAGMQKITITVLDNSGKSKSSTLEYSVTDVPLKTDIRDFSSVCYRGGENKAIISVSKKNYTGKFYCQIIPEPQTAGTFRINEEDYTPGSDFTLKSPDNTVISFFPEVTGKVKATIVISDEQRNQFTESLSYNIENPDLNLSVSNPASIFPGKEASVIFTVSKQDYHGKYYAEITGDDCTFRLNNEDYIPGTKSEIHSAGNNLKVRTAAKSNIYLRVTDEWGGVAEREISLAVKEPEMNLTVYSSSDNILLGENTNFIVTASHEAGDTMTLSVKTVPASSGIFFIGSIENRYEEEESIIPGHPVNIIYHPEIPGPVTIVTSIKDNHGNTREKQLNYAVSNIPIELTITNNTDKAKVGEESSFNFAIEKPNYSGKYYAETESKNCSRLLINNNNYISGTKTEALLSNTVSYIPSSASDVYIRIKVYDEFGGLAEKIILPEVEPGKLQIQTEGNTGDITVYHYSTSKLNFSETGYNSRDSFEYEIRKLSGDFALDDNSGNNYVFNRKTKIPAWHNSLLFTTRPESMKDVAFNVTLRDKYGQEQKQTFNYTIKNRDAKIDFLSFNETTFTEKKETFNIQISKYFFPSDLNVSISPSGDISELQVNGNNQPPTTTSTITCKTGTIIPVSYTPSKKGEIKFTVSVTDEFGLTNTKNISARVNDNNVEKLTLPVEYALTRDNSLVNDNSHFESYLDKITFDGHDGEGRISDYQTVFTKTGHVISESGMSHNSIQIGEVTFPVYTYEGNKPVDEQKQEHIFLRVNIPGPVYLKYDNSDETFLLEWGYKFVNTNTNSTILDIKGSSYCYAGRSYSYPYPEADYASFYQFHPIEGSAYHKPLAKDIRNCKIIVYCNIKAAPYKFNIENGNQYVQNNQPKSFKFSYTSFAGGINKAKVNITNISSGGSIENLYINGIPESQGVYLSPGEEATVSFIPKGNVQLTITLKEGKTSIVSVPVKFISQ